VAQIQVGAATEVAMKEKKARVEDALHACRAAVEEGILPGGGVAVIRAAAKVLDGVRKKAINEDQQIGVDIVRRAIEAPIKQIVENAGGDGGVVAQKVKESADVNFGYNALTHQYGDMLKMGVIVPTKVGRTALQNAASIASLLLTTDAIVSEMKEDKEPAGAGAPGGGMYKSRRILRNSGNPTEIAPWVLFCAETDATHATSCMGFLPLPSFPAWKPRPNRGTTGTTPWGTRTGRGCRATREDSGRGIIANTSKATTRIRLRRGNTKRATRSRRT
jgi:hypothetical protein